MSGVKGMPATLAEPDVGAISVPSVRTVVVFPAPFGSEEAEHLALRNRERDVLERSALAEVLAEVVDDECGGLARCLIPAGSGGRLGCHSSVISSQ